MREAYGIPGIPGSVRREHALVDQPEDMYLFCAALDTNKSQILRLMPSFGMVDDCATDNDWATLFLGYSLQAEGYVYAVAYYREGLDFAGAHVAECCVARVQADAGSERVCGRAMV